jgi:hypothetical protein
MPTTRSLVAGLTLALTAISCTDKGPTAPNNATENQNPASAARPVANQRLVFDLTAPQTFTSTGGPGGVPAAGTDFIVTGVRITHFAYDNGQLFVDGILQSAAGDIVGSQFTHIPATLTSQGGPTQPSCQILDLRIGEITLDVLGLVVNLQPVHLNITAVSGPGNLLGNLLCAVAHLLDQNPLAAAITELINRINALLAGL